MEAGAKLEWQVHGLKQGVAVFFCVQAPQGTEFLVCDFLKLMCRLLPIIINGLAW